MERNSLQALDWNRIRTHENRKQFEFFTGDGPGREIEVLKGFAARFNGLDKIIVTSRKPPTFHGPAPKRGFSSLKLVRISLENTPRRDFVWSCDKEYLQDEENFVDRVKRELGIFGITSAIINQWDYSARMNLRLGNREARLWCVMTGFESRIEDNISKLLTLVSGTKVGTSKRAVDAFSAYGKGLVELIREADDKYLKQSFSCFYDIFVNLHDE